MKRFLCLWTIFLAGALLTGCTHFKDPFPQLIETQAQLVAGCDLLAVIAETADADRISAYLARREMVKRVKARAVQLGATHIVWLHSTNESATAQAYRCEKR
ncbi:MAG: hypothetical protein WAU91_03860 [Desulfatitalea sp.]